MHPQPVEHQTHRAARDRPVERVSAYWGGLGRYVLRGTGARHRRGRGADAIVRSRWRPCAARLRAACSYGGRRGTLVHDDRRGDNRRAGRVGELDLAGPYGAPATSLWPGIPARPPGRRLSGCRPPRQRGCGRARRRSPTGAGPRHRIRVAAADAGVTEALAHSGARRRAHDFGLRRRGPRCLRTSRSRSPSPRPFSPCTTDRRDVRHVAAVVCGARRVMLDLTDIDAVVRERVSRHDCRAGHAQASEPCAACPSRGVRTTTDA